MAEERLQKILARAGYGSRRAAEELIEARRVLVNGKVAELGQKADPEVDRIQVDGKVLPMAEKKVYIALYKPRYVISAASSPDVRQTVRDLVPVPEQIYPVGRLDVDSEGLMLMTNDGDLTYRLTHPRYGHEKEYRVLVAKRPDPEQLSTWRRGVVLEDGYRTAPADVYVESGFGKGAWLRVTLHEGRKRQIRETGRLLGLPVVRIIRVRIGPLELGALKPREWRHLTSEEVAGLKGEPGAAGREKGRRSEEKEGGRRRPDSRQTARPAVRAPRGTPRGEGPSGQRARRGKAGEPGDARESSGGRNRGGLNRGGLNRSSRPGESSGSSLSRPGGIKPSRPPQGKTGVRPKKTRGTPQDTGRPERRDQGKGRDRRPAERGRKK